MIFYSAINYKMKKALVAILVVMALSCSPSMKNSSVAGIVTAVSGTVTISSDSQVSVGRVILKNDRIITENGSIEIQLRNGSYIKIKELSRVSMESASNIALDNGTALLANSKLSPSDEFIVRTPTAVAGVRGTRWSITSSENGTEVVVLEGSVQVNSKPVDSGFKSLTVAGSGKTTIIRAQISAQEKAELLQLPVIDKTEMNTLLQSENASEAVVKTSWDLAERQQKLMVEVLSRGQAPVAPSSLERLQLKNKTVIVGWALSQTSESLVFYDLSSKKYLYVKKQEIVSQDF